MKLRHVKRATQQRMFGPKARSWRALVQFGRDIAQAAVQAIALGTHLPDSLRRAIEAIAPEPLSAQQEQRLRSLIEAMPGATP